MTHADPRTDQIEAIYRQHCISGSAIAAHLPRLRALADGCTLAVEFGVKRGASASALLLGAHHVRSYDVVPTPEARRLEAVAGNRWEYCLEDSRTATIPVCDLLFLDSRHTYDQVRAELSAHAVRVRHRLVFHDTLTFGSVGADGETGQALWLATPGASVPITALGIRPAIDELMVRDRSWQIVEHVVTSHGLLVLERVSP